MNGSKNLCQRLSAKSLIVAATLFLIFTLSGNLTTVRGQSVDYFEVFNNLNYPGGDLGGYELRHADYRICQEACYKNPNCAAYTYVHPGVQGRAARCWLKYMVPSPVKSNCCISGYRKVACQIKINFAGNWWSTEWGNLKISQDCEKATGSYDLNKGTFNGTIAGNRLTVTWKNQDGKSGQAYFYYKQNGQELAGEWWCVSRGCNTKNRITFSAQRRR